MEEYRNAHQALLKTLNNLLQNGQKVDSRLGFTKEFTAQTLKVKNPLERLICSPKFSENIFAKVASCWWVMSGSNDLEFLSEYMPGTGERSDDNVTWRGAFGTRIRNWNGLDQLKQVYLTLLENRESRRATMVLFDPVYDCANSKDVCCTATIHFLIRYNRLEMTIDMRSVDIINGFASNNFFEWSIMHEILAYWLGAEVGTLNFFANSLHIYDRDNQNAREIIEHQDIRSIYETTQLNYFRYGTKFIEFDQKLDIFFKLELQIRNTGSAPIYVLEDKLMEASLIILQIFQSLKDESKKANIASLLKKLTISDFYLVTEKWLEENKTTTVM
jgi:thymidylate synthase